MFKEVCDIDGDHDIETPHNIGTRPVVEGDGLNDRAGEPPEAHEISADLCMGSPVQHSAFRFADSQALLCREIGDIHVFLREIGRQHQFSRVMKETGHKGVIHIDLGLMLRPCDRLCEKTDRQAVFPDLGNVQHRELRLIELGENMD